MRRDAGSSHSMEGGITAPQPPIAHIALQGEVWQLSELGVDAKEALPRRAWHVSAVQYALLCFRTQRCKLVIYELQ